MNNTITHVAMDTHKNHHRVALVFPDTGEIQEFTVRNTPKDLAKMVNKIKRQSPGQIHVCYEAGVCGFTLKRRLESLSCK